MINAIAEFIQQLARHSFESAQTYGFQVYATMCGLLGIGVVVVLLLRAVDRLLIRHDFARFPARQWLADMDQPIIQGIGARWAATLSGVVLCLWVAEWIVLA